MSNNIGKKLRERNLSQFEQQVDETKSMMPALTPKKTIEPDFSYLNEEGAKHHAGRAIGTDALMDSPFNNDFFNSKLLGFDLGPVTTAQDEELGFVDVYNPHVDFEKLRADNQSALTKVGALAVQFGGKTGVGIIGNIVGTVYGLGEWLGTEEGTVHSVYDNKVTRTLDEWNESIEAKNTLFVNPNDGIGFNFNTAKSLNDAFSFISSMIATEAVMQTVGNLAGGAGLATTPLRALRYGKKFMQIMRMLDNAEDLEKLAMRLGTTVDKLSEIKRIKDLGATSTSFARKTLTNTGYEAGLEARGTKDAMMEKMVSNMEYHIERSGMNKEEANAYRESKMPEIEKAAETGGITTFAINSALLGASNAIQFPTIFGSSYKKASNLGDLVRTGIGTYGKKEGKMAATKRTLGMFGRVLKNPATEFMEETGQGMAGKFSQNYFEVMMGDQTQAGVLNPQAGNIMNSVYKAVTDTYGTEEGLHEGIIGAIVGGIGLPGIKTIGGKKKFTWHGGIPESIRDEKQRRKDVEEAISTADATKISEIVEYNKDNAIRAAIDTQREDFALAKGDKIEFEDVQNNKVFRYTMDRMEKGMDEYVEEDIRELEEMASTNVDKYKQLFGKEATFTSEDAQKEVQAFKEKVGVYKKAYQAVHKRYNLNLIRQDKKTKKLTDTLTFAVATEKIYGERLKGLKQELYDRLGGEFTMEEIEQFVVTSSKVSKARTPYNEYNNKKNAEKWQKHKSQRKYEHREQEIEAGRKNEIEKYYTPGEDGAGIVNPVFASVRDQILAEELLSPQERRKAVKMAKALAESTGKSHQEIVDQLNEKFDLTLEYKETDIDRINAKYDAEKKALNDLMESEFTEFNPDKSYRSQELLEPTQEITDQINNDIKNSISRQMKAISKEPGKLTRNELQEYLNKKRVITEKLEKEFGSEGMLEMLEHERANAKDLFDEINAITDKHMTAVNVAAYLYGFKDNPSGLYNKIVAAEFWANYDNTERYSFILDFLSQSGTPDEEFVAMVSEFEDLLKKLEEEYPEVKKHYSDEENKEIKKGIEEFNKKLEKYNEFIATDEALKKQQEEARQRAKTTTEKEEGEEEDLFGRVVDPNKKPATKTPKDPSKPDDPAEENQDENEEDEEQDPSADATDDISGAKDEKKLKDTARHQDSNRLIIREGSSISNAENKPEFKTLLNPKEPGAGFKNKTAVTISLDPDNNLHPDNNKVLASVLEKYNARESYIKGLEKVQKDKDYLKTTKAVNLDEDVFNFVRFAPVQMNVYDKVLSPDNDYAYDIDENDKVMYNQYLFVPTEDVRQEEKNAKVKEAEYYTKLTDLNKRHSEAIKKNKGDNKTDFNTRIDAMYAHERNVLEHQYKASGNGTASNFNFRLKLLRNKYRHGNNELKLKIHNVDQGNFEVFNHEKKVVRENSIADLGYTMDTIDEDTFFYGNQAGEYVRLVDKLKTTSDLGEHPFKRMVTAVNGNIFAKFKNQAGKEVPIKLNTSKIGIEHTRIIMKQVEAFFAAQDKTDFTVRDTGIDFLDGKSFEEFLQFFMRPKASTKSTHAIYLRNTFNLAPPDNTYPHWRLMFYTGEVNGLTINSAEELKNMDPADKKDLIEGISNNRMTINKDIFAPGNTIDKRVLKYYLDNNIINHPFNVSKNYDKIYRKNYNKGIVISLAGTPDSETNKASRKNTYVKDLKNLKLALAGNKKLKRDPNAIHYNSSLMNGILNSVRRQAELSDLGKEDLTDDVIKEMIDKAINNVTNNRIDMINKVIEKHPGMYNPEHEHHRDFEIIKEDKDLDRLLKTMYFLKHHAYKNQSFKNKLADEIKLWGGKQDLFDKIKQPGYGHSFAVNKYADKKANEVTSQVTSEAQFNAIKTIVKMFDELTQLDPYIHIEFREDYQHNVDKNNKSKKPIPRSYISQKNMTAATKSKAKLRTRLTSVSVEGEPRFVNGKIVDGSIFLNVKTLKTVKDPETGVEYKKEGTDQLVLFADSNQEQPVRNIITDISLPFINQNFTIDQKALDEAYKIIKKRQALREDNTDIVLSSKNLKKLGIKRADQQLTGLEEEETQNSEYTQETLNKFGQAENNVIDDEETGEGDSVLDEEPETDVNKIINDTELFGKVTVKAAKIQEPKEGGVKVGFKTNDSIDDEKAETIRKYIERWYKKFDGATNVINEEMRESIKKKLQGYGFTEGFDIIMFYNRYKEEERPTKLDKFAGFIFEDNCVPF